MKPSPPSRRSFLTATAAAIGVSGIARLADGQELADDVVWDMHCHLQRFRGRTPAEKMTSLMQYANRMGVGRVLVYLGLGRNSHDPTVAELRRKNDETLEAIKSWPGRAFGLVYLNPKHAEFCVKEFTRCVIDGPMVGVKLWVARRCSEATLDPILTLAVKHQALVYQHSWWKTNGNLPGESSPEDVAALAERHPQARLVCGHAGGDWERGIRAIRGTKNVYLGLAGFDPTAGVTEMAVRELGAARLLYGSDVGGRSFASQLAKVQGANISAADKRLILGGNLRRLLSPILQAKGVRL